MDKSSFSGSVLGYFWVNAVYFASVVFTANILMPFGLCYRERWMAKHTIINGKQLQFNGRGTELFLRKQFLAIISPIILAIGLSFFFAGGRSELIPGVAISSVSVVIIATYLIFTLWLARRMRKWIVKHTTFIEPL